MRDAGGLVASILAVAALPACDHLVGLDAPDSLASDPKNCGAPGRDCLGGACNQGGCSPVTFALPTSVSAITVSGGLIAWTDSLANLKSLSPDGGAPLEVQSYPPTVGRDGNNVVGVAAIGSTFIWSNSVLEQSQLPQRRTQILVGIGSQYPGADFGAVVSDGVDNIYYEASDSSGFALWRKPFDGGPPIKVFAELAVAPDSAASLTIGPGALYVVEGPSATASIPLDGGKPEVFAEDEELTGEAPYLAADSRYVYWTAHRGAQAIIRRAAVAGGAAEELFGAADPDAPAELASDGTWLFWTTTGHGLFRLAVSTRAGTIPETVVPSRKGSVALPNSGPSPIALDDTSVYFTGPNDDVGNVPIMRVTK